MVSAYFAVAGLAPFTMLLLCAVAGAFRRLQARSRPLAVGAALLQVALLAGIDTAFAALLLRSVAVGAHGPLL